MVFFTRGRKCWVLFVFRMKLQPSNFVCGRERVFGGLLNKWASFCEFFFRRRRTLFLFWVKWCHASRIWIWKNVAKCQGFRNILAYFDHVSSEKRVPIEKKQQRSLCVSHFVNSQQACSLASFTKSHATKITLKIYQVTIWTCWCVLARCVLLCANLEKIFIKMPQYWLTSS